MSNVLITGGKGYIAEYIVEELLKAGHTVISIDNNSKEHHFIRHPSTYQQVVNIDGDCRDQRLLSRLMNEYRIEYVIAAAALIGGIAYFHAAPYDILAQNNAILNATLGASITRNVEQVIMISSSMVYESATSFPVHEGDELRCPPPITSYGFQKLSCEYYVRAAAEQYGLNYTIIRPFNAASLGEESVQGEPGYSHVLPDFVAKARDKTKPFEILGNGEQIRCLTHCNDIARGIVSCIGNKDVYNIDLNLVNPFPITMTHLAEMVWEQIRPDEPFAPVYVPGFVGDVRKRIGACTKAHELLGWTPRYSLQEIVTEQVNGNAQLHSN